MKRWLVLSGAGLALALVVSHPSVRAFCGFYVAKADAQLFNQASQVVLVRDDDKTVITMVNDYKGDPKEFAVVVPVPTFIERGQIHVTNKAIVDHLDAYTAPRLVEYFDPDPCRPMIAEEMRPMAMRSMSPAAGDVSLERARALGVTIEAEYTVGEYDILILSAEQSDGLETWLVENGYKMPPGASRVLGSYIRQNMRFFVARVNLQEQSKLGYSVLRPLQVAYESPKFMLPIRLGTVNADGPQDLLIYTLTRNGRVETTNYRTVKLPTDTEIPVFVKSEFGDFYKAMFSTQVSKENMRSVFLEYAWDMAWCDPCAADPLSHEELTELGVFWLGDNAALGRGGFRAPSPASNVFVTRLHVRYDGEHFPEDLMLQETRDRQNFQGRFVLRHAFDGDLSCEAGQQYRRDLFTRHQREAQTLASLTGWELSDIHAKMNLSSRPGGGNNAEPASQSWWERLWKKK